MDHDYSIDHRKRLKSIQDEMDRWGLSVYLGSRLRTLSYVSDAFCPWRSFIVIPKEGDPALFTFIIDAERIKDDSWMDDVRGFGPLGGGHQIDVITDEILDILPESGSGKIGVELGMSNYLPEGNLTTEEYNAIAKRLPKAELVNSIDIIDKISMYKEPGEIARFRKASEIVDIGHEAVHDELEVGMTETEIAGIAEQAMRKAGSVWAWSFTGGNEIASGYRTAYPMGACTPATRREVKAGEPLMVDLHAMFKLGLGDHSHNYLFSPVSNKQLVHAGNFIETITRVLDLYKPGMSPGKMADDMMDWADSKGFAQFLVPGFEHGIGLMGDEWRVGMNDGPMPYWTNPDHVYEENMMIICAMQYMAPEDSVGFRYEAPLVITSKGSEVLNKTPLEVTILRK
ncbi:MAG: M24 family metallopeptidase [Candidatus Hodarchaeales archaeon]|jgi:Xaa-Pro aminopeptidase